MKSFKTYTIEADHQGFTVEAYLKQVLQFSGRKIQKLTRKKGVLLNKKSVFLQKKIKKGDVLSVVILEDQSFGVMPEEGPIEILYEDNQIIVLNKPPRLLVHPAGHTSSGTLANYLASYFQEKGEIIVVRPLHRLDRDTSGCVVFAKDDQTQNLLEQQMKEGTFKRTYLAIVSGEMEQESGMIDLPIANHPTMPNRRVISDSGERAVTHYKVHQYFNDKSLLELELETGRTHQIRVHLAHIGHPIIGDSMYGKRSTVITRQALHAQSVVFTHPQDDQKMMIDAPLPPDFIRILDH